MNIQELVKKYNLTKDDCWQLPQNAKLWIVSHEAIEKIIAIENIIIQDIDIISSEWDFCRLKVIAYKEVKKDDGSIYQKRVITIGEALLNNGAYSKLNKYAKTPEEKFKPIQKGNCESQYVGCMAEKRGIDRAVLKLINAYEYGIYSDVESDSFIKGQK